MGRTLVTGAGGFIGRCLTEHLHAAGRAVRAAVRNASGAARGSEGGENCLLELQHLHARGSALLQDVDVVIHLAAHVHVPWPARLRSREFLQINTEATARLAEMAAGHGVRRFIFLSSAGVHGSFSPESGGRVHRFTEGDAPRPHNAYTRSKFAAELALQSVCNSSRMQYVILRLPLVFGPGARASFLRLLGAIDRGLPLPLDGVRARRSFVYVENLVRVIERCIDSSAVSSRVYLHNDFDIGVADLAMKLGDALGRKVRLWRCPDWALRTAGRLPLLEGTVNGLVRSFLVDGSKIREAIGWSPEFDVDAALRATAAWYASARP